MSESDSSSDSDDEYLTQRDDRQGSYDREAIVRKKLLENFYGKSAVASVQDDNSSGEDDDEDRRPTNVLRVTDDLDSLSFDAKAHAAQQIRNSSVQDLLETEDRLALQVRTLDSTMQTLVYENYSRFIDATDAIRSIGVNVQANEKGLRRLTEGMEAIDRRSKDIEDALGSLRDQVAEKIRVKRLLNRLDLLLRLPKTLREQIRLGKYRTAARSYLSASSILRKHSEGFESLKNIETECNSILADLSQSLRQKLLHWSGRITPYEDLSGESDEEGNEDQQRTESSAPEPPKTMTDVFECAGTLFILREERDRHNDKEGPIVADSDLSADDLQSMAASASMRLLDRLLDNHLIEVQEKRFTSSGLDGSNLDIKMSGVLRSVDQRDAKPAGSSLIPRDFLDAVLEGATLFGMSFEGDLVDSGAVYLMGFVSESFSSFLHHVRSVLFEETIEAGRPDGCIDEEGQDDFSNEAYNEISGALTLLVQYVRDLASALALLGISAEYTTKIVDQTVQLTESMVRRRVEQKFNDLRLSVVRHCILPFVNHAVEERRNAIKEGKLVLPQIVQIASNTLSDCLQLVDDAIRSIFSSGLAESTGDLLDLKEAVYRSTYRFALWLANAFEILAGGDSADPKLIIEVPLHTPNESREESEKQTKDISMKAKSIMQEDGNDVIGQETVLIEMLESARAQLSSGDINRSGSIHPDFILAIAEMCRLSQGSVQENLDQSVDAHAGGNKKKSRGIFPSGESKTGVKAQCDDGEITSRFQLAASSVLVLYASNSGVDAANILCGDLRDIALMQEEDMPAAPSDAARKMLKLAKDTSIQCFNIFGGNKRAGPVPEWENNSYPVLTNPLMSRKVGLQLDIERMFKERVMIYPHPTEMLDSSRNALLYLFFKIAFRELIEHVRLLSFSVGGLAQVAVDIEFLKHMLPHYISSEFTDRGTNACSALSNILLDVVDVTEERLCDGNYVDLQQLKRDAREIVMSFFATADENELINDFIINEE